MTATASGIRSWVAERNFISGVTSGQSSPESVSTPKRSRLSTVPVV
jgi:hypothetical protein